MDNKIKTKSDLITMFENVTIRTKWDSEINDYYFSIVDVIKALTGTNRPRKYWSDLKIKLQKEGSELSENIGQLKMVASDGKLRITDVLDTKGILRLIQSIPSPKAEPFKLWLAQVGNDKIDETFDPSLAIDRAIAAYRKKGMPNAWIESRLKGIISRHKLTDTWKESGITEPLEYAILTNDIYKTWSGMSAGEYKNFKGIRKENLKDNMTSLEILLADIGEVATRELVKEYGPQGLNQNRDIAKLGGQIAKNTRNDLEKNLNRSVITSKNNIYIQYIDDKETKQIETK